MKLVTAVLVAWTLWISTASAVPAARPGFDWEAVEYLAVQDRGRLKPLDTFARETVVFITGKSSWQGAKPIETVFGWLIAFDREWEDEPFIRIAYAPLKERLGLDKARNYFTPKEIENNDASTKLMREIMAKQKRREPLLEIEKKALQLQNQRGLLEAVISGQAMAILPNPAGLTEPWFSLSAIADGKSIPYSQEQVEKLGAAMRLLLDSFVSRDAVAWKTAVMQLTPLVKTDFSKGAYPSVRDLGREIQYNSLHPFRWAWVLYAVAFVLLVVALVGEVAVVKNLGLAALLGGFGLHAYGFILRCLIAGRPPVTNMYESVIWVAWGCVAFSLLIYLRYRNAIIPTAATVFAVVGLILADNLPLALDPNINPLEPVLRSNYWLTIHVLTITLSYAAFALSLCLGNYVLGNYLFRPKRTDIIQQFSLYMYRAMQIGVVLLAAGTILGGVWADYSWGRFWGWDPKEVWALIALLLYLAVLHGRFSGWLRGFGFVATTVIAFLGVLMAWYGVNFVLGAGLHSYGFGSGGIGYVLIYVGAQLLFIVTAYRQYKRHRGAGAAPAIFPAV